MATAMAFPIPAHLPRKETSSQVSSRIIHKLDEAKNSSLNATLARSWLDELDECIRSTKEHIHERINSNLPDFERQLSSARSIQSRLRSLDENVSSLSIGVLDPEIGTIPTFFKSLSAHKALVQASADALAISDSLSYLVQCKTKYASLQSLVEVGKLPEAVEACAELNSLFENAPIALKQSLIMADMKSKFRIARDKTEEQLSDAYSRSIVISPKELIIHPYIQVRQSETVLQFSSLLSSLSSESLNNHLSTLRRDLCTCFIDHVLKQPTSIQTRAPSLSDLTVSSEGTYNLNLYPSSPIGEHLSSRLFSLTSILDFLSSYLFPSLPASHHASFLRSLRKPVSNALLNELIIPNLPSKFTLLPEFLELLNGAVGLEEKYVAHVLSCGDMEGVDRPVKAWSESVSLDYERQRRSAILQNARELILGLDNAASKFQAEIDIKVPQTGLGIIPIQDGEDAVDEKAVLANGGGGSKRSDLDAKGIEGEMDEKGDQKESEEAGIPVEIDESGWGLDDDDIEPESQTESEPTPVEEQPRIAPSPSHSMDAEDLDPADAWGWNDDEEQGESPAISSGGLTEESAWDDLWADPPADDENFTTSESHTFPPSLRAPASSVISPSIPKVATRLEKASAKHRKGKLGESASSPERAPDPAHPTDHTTEAHANANSSSNTKRERNRNHTDKRPMKLAALSVPVPKELYLVSGYIQDVIQLLQDVLDEGREFLTSDIIRPISGRLESSSKPGSTLLLTAPSVLDLFRAVYPVKFGEWLGSGAEPGRAMQFSNDCLFLSEEVERVAREKGRVVVVQGRLEECSQRLKVLGDSWFDDTIERHRQAVDEILTKGATGFTASSEQDRYDECESAVSDVLREVRRLAQVWKGILTRSKYYTAIGLVTDAALSRVLRDILALPDITEVESHRLSELCRILNALEGLFVDDRSQPSFVVAYVPSWLKFSYLSELLEASMVDITYLFEEGALVDFEVDELVRLVQALFADTQLRTSTINKIKAGYPISHSP